MKSNQTETRVVGGPRRPRLGFSLVELLVVIAIIGVLVGLLVVVLGRAQASVRESAIATEVASMSKALQAFKTQYQTDFPPDFSTGVPVGTNQQIIARYMTRLFRYRDANSDVPIAAGQLAPQLLDSLDPAETLYFWLRGFTTDPANPLFGPIASRRPEDPAGNQLERTPIFEFDKSRLLDLDGDGFLEYYPRFASERPYVYYVHYAYVQNFAKPPANLLCRVRYQPGGTTVVNGDTVLSAPRPYLSLQANVASNPSNPQLDVTNKQNYASSDSFQIISAGLDNDFGVTVNNADINQYLPFAYPNGPYPDRPHKDNIASFTERTLEDAVP